MSRCAALRRWVRHSPVSDRGLLGGRGDPRVVPESRPPAGRSSSTSVRHQACLRPQASHLATAPLAGSVCRAPGTSATSCPVDTSLSVSGHRIITRTRGTLDTMRSPGVSSRASKHAPLGWFLRGELSRGGTRPWLAPMAGSRTLWCTRRALCIERASGRAQKTRPLKPGSSCHGSRTGPRVWGPRQDRLHRTDAGQPPSPACPSDHSVSRSLLACWLGHVGPGSPADDHPDTGSGHAEGVGDAAQTLPGGTARPDPHHVHLRELGSGVAFPPVHALGMRVRSMLVTSRSPARMPVGHVSPVDSPDHGPGASKRGPTLGLRVSAWLALHRHKY